jgi:hypothetical protein
MPGPPEIRSGILRVWTLASYTADVQLTGSLQLYVPGVNVSRNIAAAEMTPGRKVAIAFFDPTNHTDAILFAVWP